RWLDLVTEGAKKAVVTPVSQSNMADDFVDEIQAEIKILSREGHSKDLSEQMQFLQPTNEAKIPVAQGGGGERLHFKNNVLLIVVPSLYDIFNDSTLTSMISSGNIVFTGVAATLQLLERHGLDVQALRDHDING